MHIYFSGIGGAGIGPLALVAHQAGYQVSGSDQKDNSTVRHLRSHGVDGIHIGQGYEEIAAVHAHTPIDWFVYTSALPIDQPDAPELRFCADNQIKATKRDEFLSQLLQEKQQKLLAVAGTHGKTTTTAMLIWLLKQLDMPVSYSVGAKLSFGDMGEFNPESQYFVYEADEYDRNFLAFHPHMALITGLDWDHPDIYPTLDDYNQAFQAFLSQSQQAIAWQPDADILHLTPNDQQILVDPNDPAIDQQLRLAGLVNRQDAWLVVRAVQALTNRPLEDLVGHMNRFPGLSRRFEQLVPGLYSDYAHTPPKIRGALQMAHEVAGNNVVVVYEGLHNTRQHFIKPALKHLFDGLKQLYIVPSYLAREDPQLALLSPSDLKDLLSPEAQAYTTPSQLDDSLKQHITQHVAAGDTVLCITAGGGNSLDEWLRHHF